MRRLALRCLPLGCLTFFLSGCASVSKDSGQQTGTSGTTATVTGSSATATSNTMTSSGSPTSGTGLCPPDDRFECGVPVDCGAEPIPCGTLDSKFDENGCPRPACVTDIGMIPCPASTSCYEPGKYGGCVSSSEHCEINETAEGGCECGGLTDCAGGYCVPEEMAPPDCEAMSRDDCASAAHCILIEGTPVADQGSGCYEATGSLEMIACKPTYGRTCADEITIAADPSGDCWELSSTCLPDGAWHEAVEGDSMGCALEPCP